MPVRPSASRGSARRSMSTVLLWLQILQCAVFSLGVAYGNGSLWPPSSDPLSLTLGAALLIGGQILNISVFYRLGSRGFMA